MLKSFITILLFTWAFVSHGESLLSAAKNLKKLNGGAFDQNLLQQKPVLVQFWASWCKGCGDTMIELDKITSSTPGINLVIVSIDEEPELAKKYLAKLATTHSRVSSFADHALIDSTTEFAKASGVNAVPYVMLLNAKGEKAFAHEGHMDAKELNALHTQVDKEKSNAH